MNNNKKKYIPLILVLVFGTFLRFYNNLNISLWHDEAFSALMIRYPWGEMFYRLGLDVHPPMYYVFLRFWHYVFGDSLLALRGFSIFCGVGAIYAGWLFTKEAFKSEKAALWAAILIAINPFQLEYVTEARMYTFGALFALLAAYFLIKALNAQRELHEQESQNMPNLPESIAGKKAMILYYLGFTVCTSIIIYTHYYLFFTAAALGLYGLIFLFFHHKWNIKKYVPLFISLALVLISFLPWLKTFLFQYRQVQAGYWISKMNTWSIPSTFWDMLLGFDRDITKSSTQFLLVVVTLFSAYFLFRLIKKTDFFAKWLVLLCILAPFGGALLFALMSRLKGSDSSVYLDRYFLFSSLFYSIALAVWLKELNLKRLHLYLLIVYCGLNLFAFINFWQKAQIQTRPGMSAATKFLKNNVEANGSHIFLGTSFEFFNFKYYWTEKNKNCVLSSQCPVSILDNDGAYSFLKNVRPLLYTGGRTRAEQMSHVEGVALLTDKDLAPDFKSTVSREDTVWLVWTYAFGSSKPETPVNWVKLDEKEFPDIRPYAGTSIYVTQYKVN